MSLNSQSIPSNSNTSSGGNSSSNMVNTQLLNEVTNTLGVNCEEFMLENFDFKKYTNAIMKTKILGDHLSKLSLCTNILDKEIREQITLHHEDLLNQAINIETLEEMLDMVQTRIISLKSTSERLRVKITSPYNELNLRILQLTRLQSACDMLRRIKGIIHHSAKLKQQMQSGVKDIVKSSQSLNELEFLLKNFDFNGIEIIEKDIHFIHKSKHDVEQQANNLLEVGLVHQNHSQIGTALQVFFNLGCLMHKIHETLKNLEKNFNKTINDLLNPVNISLQVTSSPTPGGGGSAALSTSQSTSALSSMGSNAPGRSTMPVIGSMSQFRATLWSNIEKLMDTLYDTCLQIVQMQKILIKKKDLLTNSFYIDNTPDNTTNETANLKLKIYLKLTNDDKVVEYEQKLINDDSESNVNDTNDEQIKKSIEFLYDYFKILIDHLNKNLQQSCIQSNHIKQTLQNEYPKLLKLKNDLWLRLLQLNPLIEKYMYPTINIQQQRNYYTSYELLNKCFIELENSYLTRSLTNLFDPINLIFTQNTQTSLASSVSSTSSSALDAKKLSRNDLEQYFKSIQTQLQILQYDLINRPSSTSSIVISANTNLNDTFSFKIIKNICKSIQMFINKCEQYLNYSSTIVSQHSSSSSSSSNANANTAILNEFPLNLDCINLAYDLYELLLKLLNETKQQYSFELNDYFKDYVNNVLNEQLLKFIKISINPLYQYACDCTEAIILTIYNEDLSAQSTTISMYIKELQQVVGRLAKDYFLFYQCKSIINDYFKQLSIRILVLFVRHATMVKLNSNKIRKRLLNDSHQIELIISNILYSKLNDLGVHYKQLKAYRNLLQLSIDYEDQQGNNYDEFNQNFVDSLNAIADSSLLPNNIILNYLITSYAYNEIKMPNQTLDWSFLKYSQWLDKHTNEKERLHIIKTTLEDYVNLIKQKNEKKFTSIYPIMIQLLEKGLQTLNKE